LQYSNNFNYIFTIIDRTSKWMEAVPLSETSAVACTKALTFTWIYHFGVPKTITSDRGPQFTFNLWLQLCKMLNISYKQTTAYHPESNGALERLHRCLKDVLHAHAAAATWFEELPLYSSDSEHSRGKTLVFPRLRQFSVHKLSCQMNFCKMMNFQLTPLSKNVSAPSLPGHNSSTDLPSKLPAELLSAPLVWVRRAAWLHPFSRSTTAPTPSPSESGYGTRWSPSATLRLARPRTPRLAAHVSAADRRACTQAVLPQPSESCFQTRWFLRLLLHRRRHETVPEPFSYPARRFLHTRDRRRLHSLYRRSTHPVSGHRPRGWTSDLFSSQLRPELGGALWSAAHAPGDVQTSPAYSSQSVQCLYINHLLSVNKPVLSYHLLHLLSQFHLLFTWMVTFSQQIFSPHWDPNVAV
jgi:hypothetical protein